MTNRIYPVYMYFDVDLCGRRVGPGDGEIYDDSASKLHTM